MLSASLNKTFLSLSCCAEFPPLQYMSTETPSTTNQSDGECISNSKQSLPSTAPSTEDGTSTDSEMFVRKENRASDHHLKSSDIGEINHDPVELAEEASTSKHLSRQLSSVHTVSQDVSEITVVNFDPEDDTGSEKDVGLTSLLAGKRQMYTVRYQKIFS